MILTTDIQFRYSVKTGSSGNTTAQTNPNASLGNYISTTSWTGGSLSDLFSAVTGVQNTTGYTDYRCVFVYNANATQTLSNAVIYITETPTATVTIGVDPTGISALGASGSQAVQVTTSTTAPAGVTFSAPTTILTGIALGNIMAGQVIAVWIKRIVNNISAVNADTLQLSVSGDSPA